MSFSFLDSKPYRWGTTRVLELLLGGKLIVFLDESAKAFALGTIKDYVAGAVVSRWTIQFPALTSLLCEFVRDLVP